MLSVFLSSHTLRSRYFTRLSRYGSQPTYASLHRCLGRARPILQSTILQFSSSCIVRYYPNLYLVVVAAVSAAETSHVLLLLAMLPLRVCCFTRGQTIVEEALTSAHYNTLILSWHWVAVPLYDSRVPQCSGDCVRWLRAPI